MAGGRDDVERGVGSVGGAEESLTRRRGRRLAGVRSPGEVGDLLGVHGPDVEEHAALRHSAEHGRGSRSQTRGDRIRVGAADLDAEGGHGVSR
jgi:hypothetical protein